MVKIEVEVYALVVHVCGIVHRNKCISISSPSFPSQFCHVLLQLFIVATLKSFL